MSTLESDKFPLTVLFTREWKVIHRQVVAGVEAYVPPVPPDCAVYIECADGESYHFAEGSMCPEWMTTERVGMIKVTSLTAAQTRVMREIVKRRVDDFVVQTGTTTVVLRGTALEALNRIQDLMNDVRETEGGSSATYKSLGAVRDKLDKAVQTERGSTIFVHVLPNGASSGEIPNVLDGAPVTDDARGNAEIVVTQVESDLVNIESVPVDPDHARSNWEHMRRTAPNDAARGVWERRLAALKG